jgi:hypothetical protein
MYSNEFMLEESRWIFRLEDMMRDEQELWMQHLRDDGFVIDDPREIFEPLPGESALYRNEDVATDELRVRTWIWTDSQNRRHRLLDINAWPGDNESGIIAIDGMPTLTNGDQDLVWLPGVDDKFGFDERIGFFGEIRKYLIDNPWSPETDLEELQEDYDRFFTSDTGKQAIVIETAAWNDYRNKKREIAERRTVLEQQYISEFTFRDKLPVIVPWRDVGVDIDDIADQLGYKLKLNRLDQIDSNASFIFIQWTHPEYGCKILVTIRDRDEHHTYFLNDDGKIGRTVYRGDYLADDYDSSDPMMQALSERIHSYLKLQRNC